MMNRKNMVLLGIAIVVMSALTWWQQEGRNVEGNRDRPLVLPELLENLERLDRVEIRSNDGNVNLVKENSRWGVSEKQGYPADVSGLSALLNDLAVARIVEYKTARPENFSVLEVDDIERDGSKARLVSGYGPDYSFSLLIGKSAVKRSGQFVRMPENNQVWLTDKPLEVESTAVGWLKSDLVDIDPEDIVSVERYDETGARLYSAVREEGKDSLVLQEIPEGRELRYETVTDMLARALTSVRLTDVKRHTEDEWSNSARTRFTLADQGVIVVHTGNAGNAGWLHIEAEGIDEGEYRELADWDYKVAEYTFEDFVKTLEDFLASEPESSGDESG